MAATTTQKVDSILQAYAHSPLGALELALRADTDHSVGIYYRVQEEDRRHQLSESKLHNTRFIPQLEEFFTDKESAELEEEVKTTSIPTSNVIQKLRPCNFKVVSEPRSIAHEELIEISWKTLSIYGWLLFSVENQVTEWKELIMKDPSSTHLQSVEVLTERFGTVEEFCGLSSPKEEATPHQFTWFRLLMLCADLYVQRTDESATFDSSKQELFINRKSKMLASAMEECSQNSVVCINGKWHACLPAVSFAKVLTNRYTLRFCNIHALLDDDFL